MFLFFVSFPFSLGMRALCQVAKERERERGRKEGGGRKNVRQFVFDVDCNLFVSLMGEKIRLDYFIVSIHSTACVILFLTSG